MEIKTLHLGLLSTNCYLLSSDRAAVVIDPGKYSQEIEEFLKENSNKERIILITHGHYDHLSGAKLLQENTGVPVAVGKDDAIGFYDTKYSLSDRFHGRQTVGKADISLEYETDFTVGDITFRVIYTPGHTIGGVSYYTGDMLFSGDTLFNESVGRTDMVYGDQAALLSSVKRLYELPEETRVFPGHGEPTTIAHEKKHNPFCRG